MGLGILLSRLLALPSFSRSKPDRWKLYAIAAGKKLVLPTAEKRISTLRDKGLVAAINRYNGPIEISEPFGPHRITLLHIPFAELARVLFGNRSSIAADHLSAEDSVSGFGKMIGASPLFWSCSLTLKSKQLSRLSLALEPCSLSLGVKHNPVSDSDAWQQNSAGSTITC